MTTSWPRNGPSICSNGSLGQTPSALAGARTGIPTRVATVPGRSIMPSSTAPSMVIGCCIPMLRRPLTGVPAMLPLMSARLIASPAMASRVVKDIGSSSAGRSPMTGRGERTFTFLALRSSSARRLVCGEMRTLPAPATSSGPAVKRLSISSSPSKLPLTLTANWPARLSTTKKRSSLVNSINARESSVSSRPIKFSRAPPTAASLSALNASLVVLASPSTARRNMPARPSALNLALASRLDVPPGSMVREARSRTGVICAAKPRVCLPSRVRISPPASGCRRARGRRGRA